MEFFATCARGLEPLLARELQALGAERLRERPAGVEFHGTLAAAYAACLWSRLASRVLLQLAVVPAGDSDLLYQAARELPWEQELAEGRSFAIDVTARRAAIGNSRYATLRLKDAVVDRLRERRGLRPDVDTRSPDLRLHCHLSGKQAQLGLDLSGASLHRRGYRLEGARAPLKETLAAAILLRAGWPALAAEGRPLLDPMCGSGTLVLEAALMAADVAPGLLREEFGFLGWSRHDPALWHRLRREAEQRRERGRARLPRLVGYDADPGAIRTAQENLRRCGLEGGVHFERRDLDRAEPPAGHGLVAVNPPYGERIGRQSELIPLYARLGRLLKERFPGWHAAVLQPAESQLQIGLKPERSYVLYNGPIKCELALFSITEPQQAPAEPARDLANRVRKNLRHLGRWVRREGVTCYRVYDADLPEYALAVDLYTTETGERWAHVQEYQAPSSVDPRRAAARLRAALGVLPEVLELPAERLVYKVRRRQKGSEQYQRQGRSQDSLVVREGACRLRLNLRDYLDTGLFLDHRPMRLRIGTAAAGRRFLNLFCYAGAATVHAGVGGAVASTSVDLSSTYLDWCAANLRLNELDPRRHRLIRSDCLQWLDQGGDGRRYDRIFLDPPSFSNSKRMSSVLDVQRDHVRLIRGAAALLSDDGVLWFSTNRRGFRLDAVALAGLSVTDISAATIPPDFARRPGIHRCFEIRRA